MEETFKYGLGAKVQLLETKQTGVIKARYMLKEDEEEYSHWYMVRVDGGKEVHIHEDKMRRLRGD